VVGVKLIARDRYHLGGKDSDGGAASAAGANNESGVDTPEPGSDAAEHVAAQPDSAAAVHAAEPRHAAASTSGITTGIAATLDAVVAVTVMATEIAAVAEAGQPDTAGRAGLEVYGDSAYGTGAARAAYQHAGHDTITAPRGGGRVHPR